MRGIVNLFMRMPPPGVKVRERPLTLLLCGQRRACDLPPALESLGHGLAVHGGGQIEVGNRWRRGWRGEEIDKLTTSLRICVQYALTRFEH
jgi:hypothetical protein